MSENNPTLNTIRSTRIQKLAELADKGINPYPYSYDKNASAKMLQEKYKDLPAGEETNDEYLVAGRVMAIRNTGMFIDLMDGSGKIQIFSVINKENKVTYVEYVPEVTQAVNFDAALEAIKADI